VQEIIEKIMNLKVILNLIKQSKHVLGFCKTDCDTIEDTISVLEYKVNTKIRDLKVQIGLE